MKSVIFAIVFLFSLPAYAACSLPAGNGSAMPIATIQTPAGKSVHGTVATVPLQEGTIIYDQGDNRVEVCDGTNWQPLGSGGLECTTKFNQVISSNFLQSATCDPGYIMTGGGGTCGAGSLTRSFPLSDGTRWQINCSTTAGIQATIICCR